VDDECTKNFLTTQLHDLKLLISLTETFHLHDIQPLQLLWLLHVTKRGKAAYKTADELSSVSHLSVSSFGKPDVSTFSAV
jgi:hypothetical protein